MYQVRAEAVNGLQVLSKGRWLTCIGNKPVRKGDLVWTDGRCVYGFYQEGQTPLVILNPVDFGIPIVTSIDWFTFIKNTLKVNDKSASKQVRRFVNDRKGNVYSVIGDYNYDVCNANCDDNGNLYKIYLGGTEYSDSRLTWFTGNVFPSFDIDSTIDIVKNNQTVQAINLKPLAETILNQTLQENPNNFQAGISVNPIWGFIENETEWAFIIQISAWALSTKPSDILFVFQEAWTFKPKEYAGIPRPTSPYDINFRGEFLDVMDWQFDWLLRRDYNKLYLYYFDSNNTRKIISENYSITTYVPDHIGYYRPVLTAFSCNHDEMKSIRYPIQDGYYFTITGNFIYWKNLAQPPIFTNRNIYSPTNKLLLSEKCFYTSSMLTICQVSNDKYLLGVDVQYQWRLISNLGLNSSLPEDIVAPGLYLIENNTISRFDGYRTDIDDVLRRVHCYNQRLRPMKNYKDWQNRIQTF